jgi:multiple sugar transport system substrate-binding protein
MAMEGVYMLASLEQQKDLKFAGAPCPLFGKKRAVWGGSHLLTMPRDISGEKREAAWEFIRYLSDHSLDWAKGGQVPVRKSILRSPEFRKLDVQYQFSRELPYVVYEPASVFYNQVAPFGDAAIEAVLCRIKPTKTALDEASGRIDRVLARK